MRTWKILALAGISLFAAATARARTIAPATEPAPAAESDPPESFGGQILLADLLALGAGIGLSGASESPYPMLALWSLTAPAVHAAHGDGMGALGSLALHVLAPIAGAYIGYQIDITDCRSSDELFCGAGGVGVGLLVGAIAATTVDATLLSTMPRDHRSTAAARPNRFLAMPTVAVDPTGGGVMLGLAGRL